MEMTLKEISQVINGELIGDENLIISVVTNINDAEATAITFAVEPHLEAAKNSKAGAIIVERNVTDFKQNIIKVDNPRAAFMKLLVLFAPTVTIKKEVHPTAILGENVELGENVAIMPYVVIADNVKIGDNTVLYSHSFIGEKTVIGKDTVIYPNVTVREGSKIGNAVIIHSGAVIGSDGFGFVTQAGKHNKVPQVGNVIIEDNVEIGANVAIDRATTGSTIIKSGTKVDNLVHIAHNVVIGENGLVVAQTGIAGSTIVGSNVTFAGQCGCVGHIKIGDNTVFAARSAPINDVPANSFYAGFPAKPHKEWLRTKAGVNKVPDMLKKIKELEKRLAELESK